ncbi:MAG: glycosyltransferase family 2 protein [Oscillospiraceae bacterium]|jgi:glycosyltransferase involved in cell wall biosynthesis|nr:glycosyltransferase family 2 protein [Oscillospiraceae bacterium]
MSSTLNIVIPCYNEHDALPLTIPVLKDVLDGLKASGKVSAASRVLLVDDGSRDDTWSIIKNASETDGATFSGVKLSRNGGTQKGLLAGTDAAVNVFGADFVISTDADLQDDILTVEKMTDLFNSGTDVVYGVRNDRTADSGFKKLTAQAFYKLSRAMGIESVYNHSDYRMLSRRVCLHLLSYRESDVFIRNIVPKIGYRSETVEYARLERNAGTTKYNFIKLFALAISGIVSSSLRPVRLIFGASAVSALFGIAYFIAACVTGYVKHSLLAALWIVCAVITASIAVVGEYAGRAYIESKHRPNYFIEEIAGETNISEVKN